MKKYIFILILIITFFTIIFITQFNSNPKESSTNLTQIKKISTNETLNTTNSTTSFSQDSITSQTLRKNEINNRIEKYGKQEKRYSCFDVSFLL